MRVIRTHALVGAVCLLVASIGWAELPPDTEVVTGESQGALYAIYVPASWNGDLVLYSHGYMAPEDPLSIPSWDTGDQLVGMGYAVALSSYSVNGWAVEEGFFETRHLLPLFTSIFSNPDDVYLAGHSMGGLIALRLAEKHPGLFDGALPMCGVVGGSQMELDFVGDVRALFDYYFPGVIPGGQFEIPDSLIMDGGDTYSWLFYVVLPEMCPTDWPLCDAPDARVLELAEIDQVEIPYDQPWEAAYSILLPLWGQITATPDALERTNGKPFFDNSNIWYSGSTADAALNAGVARFRSRRPAVNYFQRWYEPTGKLRIPMLTLHTTRDGLVLITQQDRYAERVAEQGYSDNLVQRTIDRYDHCSFTVDEEVQAFLDLVNWVDNAVEPSP